MVQDANWHILSWLDSDIRPYLLFVTLLTRRFKTICACVDSLCYVEGVSVEFVLKRRYIIFASTVTYLMFFAACL